MRRVDDVLVNFVGEHKHVELLREGRDLQQLVPREYPPAWIRRIAEHKRLQAARENFSQLLRIKTIVRRVQRHMHRLDALNVVEKDRLDYASEVDSEAEAVIKTQISLVQERYTSLEAAPSQLVAAMARIFLMNMGSS